MKRLIIGTLSVIGLLAVAAVAVATLGRDPSPQATHSHGSSSHALSIPTSVAQIGDFSDLVVRGSVVSSTTVEKRPAVETDDYTAAAKVMYANLVVNLDKFTFQVDEYYMGSGGSEITIMADPSSWTLEADVTYVLFLFQSPTPEGSNLLGERIPDTRLAGPLEDRRLQRSACRGQRDRRAGQVHTLRATNRSDPLGARHQLAERALR